MTVEKTKEDDGRGIDATLAALEIDDGVPPEIAAQEEASRVAESSEDAPLEEEEEEEPSPNVVEVVQPMQPSTGENKLPPLRGVAIPTGDDTNPRIPPPAERKPPKPKTKTGSSSTGKLGKGLSGKLPGAEKVKVYKRKEDGTKWFLAEYTADDLALFDDFEAFLTRYVKPSHGAGEYDLIGVDAHGRAIEAGQVRLLERPSDNTGAGHVMETMGNLAAQQREQNETFLSRMTSLQQQPAQNPLDLLNGVMALQEKVTGKADAAKEAAAVEAQSGTATAMQAIGKSSSDNMAMMMMMMQQQQQQQQQQLQQQQQAADRQNQLMMTLLAKPKEEDPVMKLLLAKMMEDGGLGGGGGAPLPAPPPPPGNQMAEMVTALGGLLAAVNGGGGGEAPPSDTDFKEFLQAMLIKQQGEAIGPKEIIALLTAQQGEGGGAGDTFRSAVDNLSAIMNVANNINRQQEGGPASGFFDALGALFSNRDFAGSLANTIRSRMGQGQGQGQTVNADPNAAQRQRALQQRQAVLTKQQQQQAARQRLLEEAATAAGAPDTPVTPPSGAANQTSPQPEIPAPGEEFQPGGPPVPTSVVAEEKNISHTPEQVQQAAEQMASAQPGIPDLPTETYQHVTEMVEAEDEAALVGKFVQMLIYFAEFPDWRDFVEQLMGNIRGGNLNGTLEYLDAFLGGLVHLNYIDLPFGQKLMQAINTHFGTIQQQFEDLSLKEDEIVTSEQLLAGAEEEESPASEEDPPSGTEGDPT